MMLMTWTRPSIVMRKQGKGGPHAKRERETERQRERQRARERERKRDIVRKSEREKE